MFTSTSMRRGLNLILVILSFQLFMLAIEIHGYEAPPNCLVFDCPEYDVIYSIPEFEIRSYRDSNWISFPVKAHAYNDAEHEGYNRVLDYATRAQNRAGVNISLTWPILVDVAFSINSSTTTTYFYLPQENQPVPPGPVYEPASVVLLPLFQYAAVRRYHHYSNFKNIERNVLALRNVLRRTQWEEAVHIPAFTAASYNDPLDGVVLSEVLIWFGAKKI